MEVTAIKQMVVEAFDKNYFIGCIVSDDDTTMKSHLRHSYAALIAAGKMNKEDWPKTAKGHKKTDNGKLPLHIDPPSFLADPNHRTKVVGKVLFTFAQLAKKYSTIDKALAQRMKEYWGTFLKQIRSMNWDEDEKKFSTKRRLQSSTYSTIICIAAKHGAIN